jgi:hypothetical protein
MDSVRLIVAGGNGLRAIATAVKEGTAKSPVRDPLQANGITPWFAPMRWVDDRVESSRGFESPLTDAQACVH